MVNSFKEFNEKYSNHPLHQRVRKEVEGKTFNELIKLKEKSREIIKEIVSNGVMDKDDKEFLFENLASLSSSSSILDNNFSRLLLQQEERLIQRIPSGFNLSVLLHPDFPYSLSFIGSDFETIIRNHEMIMKEKSAELDRLKSIENFQSIKEELERLNKILNTTALDRKNRKEDIELVNNSLNLLRSCPF